jgi:methylglutaconyl-CoA hydratase
MTCLVLAEDQSVGQRVVRILSLNRPHKRNALNTELIRALVNSIRNAELYPDVSAIILTGAGVGFCAGGDVKEFAESVDARSAMAERASLLVELLTLARDVPIPIICCAFGASLGAGAALALAADVVIASDNLALGFPEIKDGVVPAAVMGTVIDKLPASLALELFTTGRLLGAHEARQLGLVRNVVPQDDLMAAGAALARQWTALDPDTVRATKRLHGQMRSMTREKAVALGLEVTASTWSPPGALARVDHGIRPS